MPNDPSWDEIFSSQPSSSSEPGSNPREPAVPLTRRQMREAEGRERVAAPAAETAPQPAAWSPERSAPTGAVPTTPAATDAAPTSAVPASAPALAGIVPSDAAPRGSEPPSRRKPPKGGDYRGIPKRKRRLGWLWALIVIIALAGGGAYAAWHFFEPQVRQVMGWQLPTDYKGSGNGTAVNVVIKDGDIGENIATTLHKAGVTMTFETFYKLLLAKNPTFQPGTYTLQKHMSAASALAALQDPKNHVVSTATIIEGTTLPTALKKLADGTGVPLADFKAAAADYASFGIPAEAPSLEGYLFPATYTFDPGLSAHDILQTLVNRQFQALDSAGVAVADRHRVLTMAGLIQKEGGPVADFPQVSRVFTNRIEQGMLLQSDATVSYGAGSTSIFTTDAQRADASNPYNTYVHQGLPIGPISAPGDAAIAAALNPVAGPWLYFVLVNGETGETTFSTTNAEHNAAVKVWQKWLKDHPDWNTGG